MTHPPKTPKDQAETQVGRSPWVFGLATKRLMKHAVRSSYRLRHTRALVTPGLAAVTTFLLAGGTVPRAWAGYPAVVNGDSVNLRNAASLSGNVLTQLNTGAALQVLEDVSLASTKEGEPSRWARIQWPVAMPVYIHAGYVNQGVVTAHRLNVRSGADQSEPVVGQIQQGEAVQAIRREGEWLQIAPPTNLYAYICADYLVRATPPHAPLPAAVVASTPPSPVVKPVSPALVVVPPADPPPPMVESAPPQPTPTVIRLEPPASSMLAKTENTQAQTTKPMPSSSPPAAPSPADGRVPVAPPPPVVVSAPPQPTPTVIRVEPPASSTLAKTEGTQAQAPKPNPGNGPGTTPQPTTENAPVETTPPRVDLRPPQQTPHNRFRIGAIFGMNPTASFGGFGVPPPHKYQPGEFQDGYVKDSSRQAGGATDGYTWNWGFDHADQVHGNQLWLGRYQSGTPSPAGGVESGSDLSSGFELSHTWILFEPRDARPLRIGLETAFNFSPLSIHGGWTQTAPLIKNTSIYSIEGPGGAVDPFGPGGEVHRGGFNGPDSMISMTPIGSRSDPLPGQVAATSDRKLEANIYGFRLGPWFDLPIYKRLYAEISGGLAVVVVDGSIGYRDTYISSLFTSVDSGEVGASDVMFGWYIGAALNYHLSDSWGIFYRLQYQSVSNYRNSPGGRTVELHQDSSIYQIIGVSYSF